MNRILPLLLGLTLSFNALRGQSNPAATMWNDPDFVKSFTASYGVLAEYEPAVSDEEKLVLRTVLGAIQANPKAAIQQLEAEIQPKTSAAFDFILANLYFQEGDTRNAEKYYREAVRKFPNFRRAYKNLGLLQVQVGNYKRAIETISQALQLGEVDGRSYGLLGFCYLSEGLYYPAEVAYRQAILMKPQTLDWKLGLARCLMETERYADAIALFDTLIKAQPDRTDFWLLQSNAYVGQGNPMAAARNIEIVRRMGKADLSMLTLLGDIYINNNAPSLALDAYLAALKVSGNTDGQSLVRASEILTRSANYEEAKVMISQTRQQLGERLRDSDDLKLLTFEAQIARSEGNNEAAATALEQIIQRDALNGDAIIELGSIYAAQGDLPAAINRFEQAEKIEAFERKALIAHAQALVAATDYAGALPLLRRALHMQHDDHLQDYVDRVERAARNKG